MSWERDCRAQFTVALPGGRGSLRLEVVSWVGWVVLEAHVVTVEKTPQAWGRKWVAHGGSLGPGSGPEIPRSKGLGPGPEV